MATNESWLIPHPTRQATDRLVPLYAMISQINRSIVRSRTSQDLYASTCRIAVEYGGFVLVWIGLLAPKANEVELVASAGAITLGQLKRVRNEDASAGPMPTGPGSNGTVDQTLDARLISTWRDCIESSELYTGAAFPIRLDGRIVGALNLVAAEPEFFDDTAIKLLDEVTDDISFALNVFREEEQRIAQESKMRYLAYYDAQTGLPSRSLCLERLRETCQDRSAKTVGLLVANLRQFHDIVRQMGPDAGLFIIRAMATRLESALPALALARLDESKFAVVVRAPEDQQNLEKLASQIYKILCEAIRVDTQELYLDPFIGIAQFPRDGEPSEVLRHALQASMTHDCKQQFRFYSADMDDDSRLKINLDAALRYALEREEFVLHFQPEVHFATGQIVGAEVLLRWQSHEYGLVAPQDFIPLLEENGMIHEVGGWVLNQACRCARQWQDEGIPPFRIAVNLSARQFHDEDIRANVKHALEATQLAPQWLELELTESIVLHDAENVIRIMHDLKSEGVNFALDDFGTGYSSLGYLQRLPVAHIKIDRSFVVNITSNPSDAAIVRAVIGMAHNLGLSVIAEGVESEGQLSFLADIGCEEMQGYFFSRPLPEDDFASLLREGRRHTVTAEPEPERILLLVDDEPNILSALNRSLRRRGFRILSTTSTKEAFDLLAAYRPGVVLCDQRMPELTGTEFLRRVKDLYPETVRMVLSGYAELNSVIDAINQGSVYKFLTKPWEDDVLFEHLDDAFRIYEQKRENPKFARPPSIPLKRDEQVPLR